MSRWFEASNATANGRDELVSVFFFVFCCYFALFIQIDVHAVALPNLREDNIHTAYTYERVWRMRLNASIPLGVMAMHGSRALASIRGGHAVQQQQQQQQQRKNNFCALSFLFSESVCVCCVLWWYAVALHWTTPRSLVNALVVCSWIAWVALVIVGWIEAFFFIWIFLFLCVLTHPFVNIWQWRAHCGSVVHWRHSTN